MGLLNKTRGLKLLGKDKKKPQKNEAPQKPQDVKPILPTQQPVSQTASQIQVQIPRLSTPTTVPTPSIPSLSAQMGGMGGMGSSPWWVSDVTFVVEGKRIPGHKVVLQSRSEYFTRLFQASPPAQEFTIEVVEFSHHTFSQFVRWIYGGKKDLPLDDAPELLRCASFYEAPELISLCNKLLADHQASFQLAPPVYEYPQVVEAEPQHPAPIQAPAPVQYPEHMLDPSIIDEIPAEMDFTDPSQLEQYLDPSFTLDQNYEADDSFGMTVWSNDPILFNPDATDAFRIMEIC